MLTQPKLVKADHKPNKPINLKSQSSGSARFLLGLNNRVSHMDKRLQRLEATSEHILRHHVGYRELGLTLALALLLFTSVTLALKEFTPNSTQELQLLEKLVATYPNLKQLANPANQTSPSTTNTREVSFKWPLERQLNNHDIQYAQHKHGIELNAKLGDPVVAIEQGRVLYSGNAINSYGNLILIQHPNDIISVYGNNYSNYVTEGTNVSKGQLIAAVGESDGKQPRLYFEVRYKGKAQDPFLYFK